MRQRRFHISETLRFDALAIVIMIVINLIIGWIFNKIGSVKGISEGFYVFLGFASGIGLIIGNIKFYRSHMVGSVYGFGWADFILLLYFSFINPVMTILYYMTWL